MTWWYILLTVLLIAKTGIVAMMVSLLGSWFISILRVCLSYGLVVVKVSLTARISALTDEFRGIPPQAYRFELAKQCTYLMAAIVAATEPILFLGDVYGLVVYMESFLSVLQLYQRVTNRRFYSEMIKYGGILLSLDGVFQIFLSPFEVSWDLSGLTAPIMDIHFLW
eukprot:CAMPEP_0115047192 /NCGR_PEP_ID=MMETSP0216-20121206/49172_1 /TAXON_ID=223996 /ORGANISM="Protocruzia adherens, Strain Boccale" /LENGTH=166 /DNA_ID=CAMNT_0002430365 /DNA_START=582 /DNA_END=1079 /DNA_ORIENTATION=-